MSNLQNVPTVVVQDYEYGTDGRPLANTEVTVRLAVTQGLVGAGVTGGAPVNLEPIEARVKTDSNGFWSVSLVRNSDITPAGTYYTVKVGLIRQYQIQVPAGAGPFTASAILVGSLPFFPSGSSVAGPITINGNLIVTGTGTFSGALTANAGLAVVGGGNIAGGLTVGGLLTMTDTNSRLVPGATSWSVRDNANLNDNLLVANTGNVTVRGNLVAGTGLTVSAGGASITGDETLNGRLVLVPASAKIVGGATQLSLRNNADSADNVVVADAGTVQLRNALSIPTSAGGAIAPSSYGSVPLKYDEQVLSTAATCRIPASGSLPTGFRKISIDYRLRADNAVANDDLFLRVNGDTGTNYDNERIYGSGTASITLNELLAQTQMVLAFIPGTNAPAGYFAHGTIEIFDYNDAASDKVALCNFSLKIGNATGQVYRGMTTGTWRTTNAAITFLQILLNSGNMTGVITTTLYP